MGILNQHQPALLDPMSNRTHSDSSPGNELHSRAATRSAAFVGAGLLLATCLVACGSLGGDGGGAENLPNRGIVPYVLVEEISTVADRDEESDESDESDESQPAVEAPATPRYVLPIETRYLWPSVAVMDDTWYLVAEAREGRRRFIIATQSDDQGVTWSPPTAVVEPELLPESYDVSDQIQAPCLVVHDGMFYVGFTLGDGDGIALARGPSLTALTPDPSPILLPEADHDVGHVSAPSLVPRADGMYVYYTARGADTQDENGRRVRQPPHVALAILRDGAPVERVGVVLGPDVSCAGVDGDCFEAAGAGGPEVRIATTYLGREVWRMFFSNGPDANDTIGFAGSFDGVRWDSFPFNPVVDNGNFDHFGATNVMHGSTYHLLYTRESRSRGRGIVHAINDRPGASEFF